MPTPTDQPIAIAHFPAAQQSVNQSPLVRQRQVVWQWTLAGLLAIAGLSPFGAIALVTLPATAQATAPATTAATQRPAVLLVHPALGDDAVADGSHRAPFRTISQALRVAQPNTVILLAPGTYSATTGEAFPLQLKSGVALQGNAQTRGQNIVIQGSGSFLSRIFARQNVTVVGANQAALVGVTVINPDAQGYGLWVESTSPLVTDNTFTNSGHDGISVVGNSAPLIRNNYFYQNGANGITIYGTSRPEVRENIFEQTGFAINVNQNATPLLIGNRITNNKDGIVVQANSRPLLRSNSIEGNERDGMVAIARSRPDLGTLAEPGSNVFRNNGQYDVNAQAASEIIPAVGNSLTKTIGRLDARGVMAIAAKDIPSTTGAITTPMPPALTLENGTAVAMVKAVEPAINKTPPDFPKPPVSLGTASETVVSLGASIEPSSSNAPNPPVTVAPRAAIPVGVPTTTSEEISAASFPVPSGETPASSTQSPVLLVRPESTMSSPASAAFSVPVALSSPRNSTQPPLITTAASAPKPAQYPILVPPPERLAVAPQVLRPMSAPVATNSLPVNPLPVKPLPTSAFRQPAQSTAIPIPVPAPESRSIATPVTVSARPLPRHSQFAVPAVAIAPNLLPVPDPNAPIGNVGRSPAVKVYRQTGGTASSAFTASRSLSLGLRYRVLVEADDDARQAQVRTFIPDAFPVAFRGRTVMQAGAFGDRDKANELLQALGNQGLRASIEPMQ